jgi:hypothetical protein
VTRRAAPVSRLPTNRIGQGPEVCAAQPNQLRALAMADGRRLAPNVTPLRVRGGNFTAGSRSARDRSSLLARGRHRGGVLR